MKNLGAGAARYMGRAKTLFQVFLSGAVVNLRRLFARLAPALAQALLLLLLPLLFLAFGAQPARGSEGSGDRRPSAAPVLGSDSGCQPAAPASTSFGGTSPSPTLLANAAAAGPLLRPSALPLQRRRLLSPGHSPRAPPLFPASPPLQVPRERMSSARE